ncbi:hypothetical protein D9756_009595 [Leucocoprinus leucothites]|uniref:Calcineurin-like phosphoesterase domain-containing protein n=1 Tax=Leucocoprinus leucothites TaxID=201217 RepID=A0A8H5FSW5_9AGAR|nr:hypothetical protein D9756_009595 [Leucoagaricus leucothites]
MSELEDLDQVPGSEQYLKADFHRASTGATFLFPHYYTSLVLVIKSSASTGSHRKMALTKLMSLALSAHWILVSPFVHIVHATPPQVLPASLNPYPDKPRIVFRDNGTLKITVFSDLHYGEYPGDSRGPEQDRNSTRVMNRVLKDEQPDYVVINGDLITGDYTFKENATMLIDEIVAPLNAAKVPFSSSHGVSHVFDIFEASSQIRCRTTITMSTSHMRMKLLASKKSLLSVRSVAKKGLEITGFQSIETMKTNEDDFPSLILWFFDSRGGVSQQGAQNPDYVDASVAGWMESETKEMEKAWGPATKRSTLAFVHIPPLKRHYISSVQNTITPEKNPGLNANSLAGSGSVQASLSPENKEKDAPFWDAVKQYLPNLVAVVSGHDHGNEWCAREPTKDVIFCFDKHSGYGGYGEPEWGYGVRNVVFHSSSDGGLPKVESWIRLEEGATRAHVWLDDTLGR